MLTDSLGIKLQDYFLFNKYNLLVEGKSDKIILENFIREFNNHENNIPNLEELSIFNCKSANSIPVFFNIYSAFDEYASFFVLLDGDKAGDKAVKDLRDNGVEKNKIIQIKDKTNKNNPEIEDLPEKNVWEECLTDLDRKELVTLKMNNGKIVDYEYEPKNREKVKEEISNLLIEKLRKDKNMFNNYLRLLKEIKNRFTNNST